MVAFLVPALFGLGIFLSFAGYGAMIGKLLRRKGDLGHFASWGLAFGVLVGGWLNLGGWVSARSVQAFIVLGLVLAAVFFAIHLRRPLNPDDARTWMRDRAAVVGVAIVSLLLILRYLESVSSSAFNETDDFHAYFVFPVKMMQNGSLGADPFSERRLAAALGGQSFLHAMMLAVGDLNNLHVMDSGIALLIMAAHVVGLRKELGMRPVASIAVLLVLLCLPSHRANTTAVFTGAALLLSLFRLMLWASADARQGHEHGTFPLMGFLVGAVCTLKSTFIVPALAAFGLYVLWLIVRGPARGRLMIRSGVATLLALAVMVPWMIALYHSSGTLLYPLLGSGFHGSNYGAYPSAARYLSPVQLMRALAIPLSSLSFLILSGLALGMRLPPAIRRAPLICIYCGVVIGVFAITVATGGYITDRYAFPFVLPALLVLICRAFAGGDRGLVFRAPAPVAAAVACAALLGASWDSARGMYQDAARGVLRAARGIALVPSPDVVRMDAVNQKLPRGETILARVAHPFLLDFRNRRIFINDHPGAASPPPGIPSFKGPRVLADYLLSQGIRYVVYSYGDEAGFPFDQYKERLESGQHPWIKAIAERTFDFHANLTALARMHGSIFDDGHLIVIDLGSPLPL